MPNTSTLTPIEEAIKALLLYVLELNSRGFGCGFKSLSHLASKARVRVGDEDFNAAVELLTKNGLILIDPIEPWWGVEFNTTWLRLTPEGRLKAQEYFQEEQVAANRGELGFKK